MGIYLENEILNELVELYEKHDASIDVLKGCGYSSIHYIDAIGKLEKPNVTKIAKKLNMTRGAINKITKSK